MATGFFTGWATLGSGTSGFSAVFAADEVVGRIILARKESGAAAPAAGRLVRDGCFFSFEGGGPSDGLLLARLGDRDWAVPGNVPDALLSDCLAAGGGGVDSFEPEEAVCAVSDAGSLIGRVGDLGFGFTKPVCGGDAWILVRGARAVVEACAAGFELWLAVAAGFFVTAAFEDASLE